MKEFARKKAENQLAEQIFKPIGRKNRLIARKIVRKQLKSYKNLNLGAE